MSNSYAAGGIGQSITIGNTQTNVLTAFSIDWGSSSVNHNLINVKGITSDLTTNFLGIVNLNNQNWAAVQAVANMATLAIWRSFNSNSSFHHHCIYLNNSNNAWTWYNVWMWIANRSTEWLNGLWAWLHINQNGEAGTALSIATGSNVNSSSNGIVNYTLWATQSGATVMQKIDLGTSAQWHTGLLINAKWASTSQRGIKVDLTGGSWRGIEVVTSCGP